MGTLVLLVGLFGGWTGDVWWEKVLRTHGWTLRETTGWVREGCLEPSAGLNTEFWAVDPDGRLREGLVCCPGFQDLNTCTIISYDKWVQPATDPGGLVVDDRSEDGEEPPSVDVP